MNSTHPLWLLLAGVLCPGLAQSAQTGLDIAEVRLVTDRDTIVLQVEVARTEAERSYGLMERTSLGERSGMLFQYPEGRGPNDGFWMFRTRIPLDIAFVDSQGVIRAILGMAPCPSETPGGCPIYRPGVAYEAALEVNRGFFRAHGVTVGARLIGP